MLTQELVLQKSRDSFRSIYRPQFKWQLVDCLCKMLPLTNPKAWAKMKYNQLYAIYMKTRGNR